MKASHDHPSTGKSSEEDQATAERPKAEVKDEVKAEIQAEGESKKRKKHEGETLEERAERKKRKKEKKEKKQKRRSKQPEDSDEWSFDAVGSEDLSVLITSRSHNVDFLYISLMLHWKVIYPRKWRLNEQIVINNISCATVIIGFLGFLGFCFCLSFSDWPKLTTRKPPSWSWLSWFYPRSPSFPSAPAHSLAIANFHPNPTLLVISLSVINWHSMLNVKILDQKVWLLMAAELTTTKLHHESHILLVR